MLTVNFESDFPTQAFLKDESHTLDVKVDEPLDDVYLEFSSRLAMQEFAKSLLYASVWGGNGFSEHHPHTLGANLPVVNGIRLTRESVRLFILYPGDMSDSPGQEAI
jgi:hypothetical protein